MLGRPFDNQRNGPGSQIPVQIPERGYRKDAFTACMASMEVRRVVLAPIIENNLYTKKLRYLRHAFP
jgi:hypothetical protein